MVLKMLNIKLFFSKNFFLDPLQYPCLIEDGLWKYSHGFEDRYWKSYLRLKKG